MGRTVPTRWQQARESLQQTSAAYLSLERVLDICRERNMDEEETRLFVRIAYGRELLEHIGNDVRITVHTPYPEGFLSVLTHEVKWLVQTPDTVWQLLISCSDFIRIKKRHGQREGQRAS